MLTISRMKGAKLVPPFLVNNPDISILPARTNESPLTTSKQSSVSTVNRVSRGNYLNINR